MDTGWGLSGLREPDQSQGDALRVVALTRLKGFVSVLGEELRRDLDSGSPDSEGWQLRQASVESRQVQLQELRQMLNDVRETTPEEMRQIRQASNVRPEPMATADAVDGVVQELHDAIGRNVRLARREAVLEAYCEEQNKILRCVESSESRLKDCEAQESGKIEELKQAKLAAEREALEMKVSWRKDRMELHRVQMELQQAQQAVANLQEQLSEVAQKEEAQRGLLQSARVTDIQATVWQSKVANQAKDLERLKSRCAELDSERILNRGSSLGQYQSLEAWAADAKQVESQQALQKKIFQERCVELQAKLDKSRVAYYEKGRELQVVRIQHEEERQQLQQQKDEALRGHQSMEKEKRMLQEKVTDLEVQIAESLLSSSYHASQHGQLRARVEDLSTGGKSQELVQQLAELDAKYQDLEGRYAVANAARSGLARQCGLLEEENARLEESLSKELRDKEDLLESHAESSVASASKLAERLRHFERQQQELETEAAEDRSRLRMELANAEAQHADMERLRERERLVEQLKMQYHLAQKLLVRFRGVHDALAWKDLMAEVDLTILSIAQAGGAKGMGQGMVLTELVTQLHHLAESAQQQTERRQIQLESAESAAEAAQQQQFAAELRQEELETQNLRLEAELAKTQMIQSTLQDSKPLALPDDLPEEYSAIIKEVVLNGWDSVEWGGNFTLLHWAAMQNRQHLCQSLLELRANPSLRDDTGMTAADYAREKGHQEVTATLQSVHLLKR